MRASRRARTPRLVALRSARSGTPDSSASVVLVILCSSPIWPRQYSPRAIKASSMSPANAGAGASGSSHSSARSKRAVSSARPGGDLLECCESLGHTPDRLIHEYDDGARCREPREDVRGVPVSLERREHGKGPRCRLHDHCETEPCVHHLRRLRIHRHRGEKPLRLLDVEPPDHLHDHGRQQPPCLVEMSGLDQRVESKPDVALSLVDGGRTCPGDLSLPRRCGLELRTEDHPGSADACSSLARSSQTPGTPADLSVSTIAGPPSPARAMARFRSTRSNTEQRTRNASSSGSSRGRTSAARYAASRPLVAGLRARLQHEPGDPASR